MIDEALVTAEEFAERIYDLPESGRWTELVAGRILMLQPPDELHGNVVLNFSKAMAALYQSGGPPAGMACFDVGLYVRRNPDWILSPAMSFFTSESGFAPLDEIYTTQIPRLVCEVASTNDRRKHIAPRVTAYLEAGVEVVWIMDPLEKCCHVYDGELTTTQLSEDHLLEGGNVVPGFRVNVGNLFADPSWWK